MSTTVSYKGNTIATVSNDTKTLLTEGKYLEDDLTLVDVSGSADLGTKNITANGTYEAEDDELDGYSKVTVNVPDQVTVTDKAPYIFRQSGGDKVVGQSERDMLVGGTIAWNQLCNSASVTVPNGHKYIMRKGGVESVGNSSGTALTGLTSGTDIVSDLTQMFGSTIANYVYTLEQATTGSGIAWLRKHGFFTENYYPYDAGTLKSVEGVSAHKTTSKNLCAPDLQNGQIGSTGGYSSNSQRVTNAINRGDAYVSNTYLQAGIYTLSVNDLTQCTVLTKDTSGTIIDNFAGSWQTLPFTFTMTRAGYVLFTGRKASGDLTPSDYHAQIEVGSSASSYVAYVSHSYTLDDSLTLRGIPKLDADNHLYYDGDTYESDGTVTRKYGIVDLGTLSYTRDTGNSRFYASLPLANAPADSVPINAVCPRFTPAPFNKLNDQTYDRAMMISSGKNLSLRDTSIISYNVTQFTEAMSGVYLVYELATPTTETADPFADPQLVDKDGTEEYVTTSIVPVGHETKYPVPITESALTAEQILNIILGGET